MRSSFCNWIYRDFAFQTSFFYFLASLATFTPHVFYSSHGGDQSSMYVSDDRFGYLKWWRSCPRCPLPSSHQLDAAWWFQNGQVVLGFSEVMGEGVLPAHIIVKQFLQLFHSLMCIRVALSTSIIAYLQYWLWWGVVCLHQNIIWWTVHREQMFETGLSLLCDRMTTFNMTFYVVHILGSQGSTWEYCNGKSSKVGLLSFFFPFVYWYEQ